MKIDILESIGKENPALSLKTHQDALDFIDKCVKRGNDAFARLDLGTPKSYIEPKIVLVLRVFVGSEQLEFDLVFRSVPTGIAGRPDSSGADEPGVLESYEDGCDQGVFVPVAQVVDCPQGSVPSLVSLEVPKTRTNLLRDGGTTIHAVIEGSRIISKRETTSPEFRIRVPVEDGATEDGMIERGPDVAHGVANHEGKIRVRHGFKQAEFVKLVSRFRVFLGNHFTRVANSEPRDENVKIVDVMLCPVDL
jgi:hypothetical protein